MPNAMAVAATTLLLILVSLGAAEDPPSKTATKPPPSPPKTQMVVDRTWVPEPGDRAVLRSASEDEREQKVFVTTDMFAYQEYMKFLKANDSAGLKGLLLKRQLALVEPGTPILVIKRHKNPLIADGATAIELRILDGEQKDVKVWVYEGDVNRMIEKPAEPDPPKFSEMEKAFAKAQADKAAAKAKANSPETKANTLLNVGKNLEKDGRTKPALEQYRKVVKDYAGTPAAKEAAKRIQNLDN